MNEKILRLGLIGKDVSKSDSERIHTFILKQLGVACEYERFSVTPDAFDNAIRRLLGDFDGFNVTIPYKRDVMEYLNEVRDDAFAFSAVNTVVTHNSVGYNTDGLGFMLMLREADVDVRDKKILVLGLGGSGRSTAAVLKQSGGLVYGYQRDKAALLETCSEIGICPADNPNAGGYDIVINCTGVGMHKTEGVSPVTAAAFDGVSVAVDLIYVPAQSEFLRIAKQNNIKTINGAAMLFYQAYYADCLYLDRQPSDKEAVALYQKFKAEKSTEDVRL